MKRVKEYKNISLNLTQKELEFIDEKRKTAYNMSFTSFCLSLIRDALKIRYKDEYLNYVKSDNIFTSDEDNKNIDSLHDINKTIDFNSDNQNNSIDDLKNSINNLNNSINILIERLPDKNQNNSF